MRPIHLAFFLFMACRTFLSSITLRKLYAFFWVILRRLNFICRSFGTPCLFHLNKGRPTWWHLLYYVNLLLNMFQTLIRPSSGACDYLVLYCVGCIVLTWGVLVLCSGIGCWWCGIRVQAEPLLVVMWYSSVCWTTTSGDVVSECRLNH